MILRPFGLGRNRFLRENAVECNKCNGHNPIGKLFAVPQNVSSPVKKVTCLFINSVSLFSSDAGLFCTTCVGECKNYGCCKNRCRTARRPIFLFRLFWPDNGFFEAKTSGYSFCK